MIIYVVLGTIVSLLAGMGVCALFYFKFGGLGHERLY